MTDDMKYHSGNRAMEWGTVKRIEYHGDKSHVVLDSEQKYILNGNVNGHIKPGDLIRPNLDGTYEKREKLKI